MYIIAPAANDKAYGKMIDATVTATAPNIPKIGSTMPDSWPYQNALGMLKPAACSGKLTANPSGKFWIPIPMAKFRADSNVAESEFPIAPKLTPTASPSGILCTVMAITYYEK